MKRAFKFLVVMFMFVFMLVGCNKPPVISPSDSTSESAPTVEKYTVQFYVEDELYKTLRIEENTAIGSANVENPTLDGHLFVSWVDADNAVIDLDTYLVTKALKLYATFEEIITDDTLIVNGKKEEGVDYYLVVGWWETTALDENGDPKITSSLTVDSVRLFYSNLNLYLKAYGATSEQIKAVQFRDYSSETVAIMGENINADGDVDLLIGVGNNINSTAGVSLFEGNDGKTKAKMGSQNLERYVALPEHEVMNPLAISIFDWIKTEVGQTAFTTPLNASDIVVAPERTDEVNVKVTVYGDNGESKVTQLVSKSDEVELPTITVEEGYKFLGYATTQSATAAELILALGVTFTYKEIESILAGANELSLYPVFAEEIINTNYDMVVYVHVVSSAKISEAEANLFAYRFEQTLEEPKNINYVWVTEGKSADFQAKIEADIAAGETIDVVIGGNATTKNLVAIDETYVNASCASYHFADTSRKVIVLNSAASTHVDLAKQFYSFMTTEAPELALSFAYWDKNGDWVTAEEMTAVTEGIKGSINTLFGAEDAFATYNIKASFYDAENTKVGDLSAETKALNDGKGVGMIIGTGGNATDEDKMGSEIIEQKDCPTTLVAAGRKVAICKEVFIYRAIYENYFASEEAAA